MYATTFCGAAGTAVHDAPELELELVVDPVLEPVLELVVDPVLEPVLEPVVDPVLEPVLDPLVDPVLDPPPPLQIGSGAIIAGGVPPVVGMACHCGASTEAL